MSTINFKVSGGLSELHVVGSILERNKYFYDLLLVVPGLAVCVFVNCTFDTGISYCGPMQFFFTTSKWLALWWIIYTGEWWRTMLWPCSWHDPSSFSENEIYLKRIHIGSKYPSLSEYAVITPNMGLRWAVDEAS